MPGVAWSLVLLSWVGLAALSVGVHGERALGWDAAVVNLLDDVVPVSEDGVNANPLVWSVMTGLGLAVAALGAWHLLQLRLRLVAFAFVAAAGTVVLTELAKRVVSRPIVEGSGDASFPSGTATWTLAASVVILLLEPRRMRWLGSLGGVLVVVVAALIVWERWHYPSDIVGGWLLAAGWVGAVWLWIGSSEREGAGRLLREHPPDRE